MYHNVLKVNLHNNVLSNNQDDCNAENEIGDQEADELEFLSSRFAEYKDLPANERNVVGHRPQGRASGGL